VPLLIILLGIALVIAAFVVWFEPPMEGGVLTVAGTIISFIAGLGASIKGWKDLFKKDESSNNFKQEMTNQSEISTPIQAQTVNIYQSALNQPFLTERENDVTTPQSKQPEQIEIFHNLPPRNEFIGRKKEKARGHESLLSLHPNIISIDGFGGIGKTALALELAYECLNLSKRKMSEELGDFAIFEGFIWTTAKDHELTLDNILDEIAQTLDQDIIMKQPLEEKQTLIKKIFRNKKCLLIIDGYESIRDVKVKNFLLRIPESSKVLITSREQGIDESGFVSVKKLSVKGLSDTEALELIRSHGNILGLASIENAEDNTLLQLYESTDGHPLAIKWALGQIKQKGQSLNTVLDFLKQEKTNISNQIVLRSWELLSKDAQHILRIMPIFANDTFQEAIQKTSGIEEKQLVEALGQLVEMSLVDATDTLENIIRYSIHPLTRGFAREKLEANPEISYNAKRELAIFFEKYTRDYGGLWNIEGFKKLRPDIQNIISIIRWCWQEKLIELGVNIFHNIRYFIVNYGLWNTALELAEEALNLFQSTEKLPNSITEWQTKVVLFRIWPTAWIYRFRGRYEEAKEQINLSLSIFSNVGDKSNLSMAKRHLGLVLIKLGEIEEAEFFLQESLEFEKSNDVYRSLLVTADLADLALIKGDLNTAGKLSEDGIKISNQEKNAHNNQSIARFYRVLGSVARQKRDIMRAKDFCEKSLQYIEGLQYLDGVADASFELAQIEIELGKKIEAYQKYERAHSIYKSLGMEQKVKEIEMVFTQLLEKYNDNK